MTATQQTKTVKQIIATLVATRGVSVKSDPVGSMVRGAQSELVTAAAMLRAAGFDVLWFGEKMLSAEAKQ